MEHVEHQWDQLWRTLPNCGGRLQEGGDGVQELAAFVLDGSIVGDRHAGSLNLYTPAQFLGTSCSSEQEVHCWGDKLLVFRRHALHVRHLDDLFGHEVLADNIGFDCQDFFGEPGHILLETLDADAGVLGLQLLRT